MEALPLPRPRRRRDDEGVKKHQHAVAALALSASLQGPDVQLLPAGYFNGLDGRPYGMAGADGKPITVKRWFLDAAAAAKVVEAFNQRKTPVVIDYEHQSLYAGKTGQPAPAAGWFERIEWREGQGLFALNVQWTEKAKGFIKAGEYRFISPVILFNRNTGAVLELRNAALTNNPNIDGMAEVAAATRELAHYTEEDSMNEKFLAALGLAKDATEEQVLTALTALTAKAGEADKVRGELAALKAEKPDPAEYVPMAAFSALQADFQTLKAGALTSEVAALVEKGLQEGRILPALKEWATGLGMKSPADLKAYLEKATPVAAALTQTQTQGKPPAGDPARPALSGDELAVCSAMGVTPEDYAATKAAEGGNG